jgi:hypothetical protein
MAEVERELMKHMKHAAGGEQAAAAAAEVEVAQLREIVRRFAFVGDASVWGAAAESAAGLAQVRVASSSVPYSDEKVANREIRVWHFVKENGY